MLRLDDRLSVLYPNMHWSWTKFTQNLFYASSNRGLAALIYSPGEVNAEVTNGVEVNVFEETGYPFNGKYPFTINMQSGNVSFPFHLRIPAWCKEAQVEINGKKFKDNSNGQIIKIDREWKNGDVLELYCLF